MALVVSNHRTWRSWRAVRRPLPRFPITPNQGRRSGGLELLAEASTSWSRRYCMRAAGLPTTSQRIINIHHSFLPAFSGGRPYHQAHERGVKLIGATAHYATKDLDEGPIIEQDVIRASHRDTVDDLVRKGRDVERVLSRRCAGRRPHPRGDNRTVVFE
jgi:formyltetrahydrofolate deformylase